MVTIELGSNRLIDFINYAPEAFDADNNPATDDEVNVIKVTGNVPNGGTGVASFTFDEPSGRYNISTAYFDEPGGNGRLELRVNGTAVGSIELDQATGTANEQLNGFFATDIALATGDRIAIVGTRDNQEYARVASLNFTASNAGEAMPSPLARRVVAQQST